MYRIIVFKCKFEQEPHVTIKFVPTMSVLLMLSFDLTKIVAGSPMSRGQPKILPLGDPPRGSGGERARHHIWGREFQEIKIHIRAC